MNIPRSTGKHKIIIVLITVILLIVLTWFVNSYFSLVDLVDQEQRFRTYIALNPRRAFVVGTVSTCYWRWCPEPEARLSSGAGCSVSGKPCSSLLSVLLSLR